MFTGIIRHLGVVERVTRHSGGARIEVRADSLAPHAREGASICVNGVCLTVAQCQPPRLQFDVIAETLRQSTLGDFEAGTRVNLEDSLRPADPIDGHFVQGHVDGTATLKRRETSGGEHILWLEPTEPIRRYIAPKGSVAIDGISLTVASVADVEFSVAIIPTTLNWTTLNDRRVGEEVNIETDMLARTVIHYLESLRSAGGLTIESLREHGFA